MHVRDKATIEY